jgi:hypothetical protein
LALAGGLADDFPPDCGGGIFSVGGPITNCTFSGNLADAYGGGICIYDGDLSITNCILLGDTAKTDGNEIALVTLFGSPKVGVSYCDVNGGQANVYVGPNCVLNWGPGNIDADPCFVGNGNYRLLSGSPCIDAGDNNSVSPDYTDLDGDGNTTEPTPLDLDDFPRFIDDLCTTNTGNGTPPIVDMGAYEFLRSDINHNGSVNFNDFALFALQWLKTDCGECCGAELTCDGQVEWADLRQFAEWWLAGTAP